jgi:hypothetical protein
MRVACGIGGDIRAQSGVGGETPGAVHDHPHRQTHLAVQYRRLQLSVTQLHDLGGDGVDSQVSVASPAGGSRRERRVGQSGTWQRKKVLVDAVRRAHGSTVMGWTPGQSVSGAVGPNLAPGPTLTLRTDGAALMNLARLVAQYCSCLDRLGGCGRPIGSGRLGR